MLQSDYLADLRDLLHDPNDRFSTATQKKRWINKARADCAKDSQSVRRVARSSGSVTAVTLGAGGSGYTFATVTISAPNASGVTQVTATATATILAGAITGFTITNPGVGYITAPTVTITGDGTGATATTAISSFLNTVAGQEVYNFSAANTVLQVPTSDGISKVIGVQSVSISWGSLKPTLDFLDWSAFQAYYRSYNLASQNYPAVWSQYGQGVAGSVYLWPIPALPSPMEWDCYCLPVDLVDDTTPDALPDPWPNGVQWRAAVYAMNNAQRRDDSQNMDALYRKYLMENRAGAASPARIPTMYGMG